MNAIHSHHSMLSAAPPLPQAAAGGEEADGARHSPTPANHDATSRVAGVNDGQATDSKARQSSGPRPGEHAASDQSRQAAAQLAQLSSAEKKQLTELQSRDRQVRAHERAHLAAAGQHATTGARYSYQRGPDGRNYAVGGSVGIDTSAEADPEATIAKADQIKRAALAPAEPSHQDRSVAAAAVSMRIHAQAELIRDRAEQRAQGEATQGEHEDSRTGAAQDTQKVDGQQASTGAQAGIDTQQGHRSDDGHAHETSPAGACAVCGGSHGSEGHVAANQQKIDSAYAAAQQEQSPGLYLLA